MIVTLGGRQILECIYITCIKTIALIFTQSCEKIGRESINVYGELFCPQKDGLDGLCQEDECLFIRKQLPIGVFRVGFSGESIKWFVQLDRE